MKRLENDLIDMLRQSARTWDEVFTVMGSDFKKAMLSFTKEFEQGAGGRIGSQLLGISKWIAENPVNDKGTIGDNLAAMIPNVKELSGLVQKGIHTFGRMLDVGGQLVSALGYLIPVLGWLGGGVLSVAALLNMIVGFIPAVGRFISTWIETGSLKKANKAVDDPNTFFGKGFAQLRAADTLATATSALQPLIESGGKFISGLGQNLESWQIGREHIDNALGGTPEIQGPVAKIAENTEELKKQGAKMQSVQLELLKQISGKAVINRVTRVTPNVVANVGTIKSGVEYDQFMRDLTRSVHLATANVAY